jgi:hypothetical protein
MNLHLSKRLAPAVLALSVAGSGLSLAVAPAWASTRNMAATSTKATTEKIGDPCTKAEVGKVAKVGRVAKLECVKEGSTYKYELVKK